MNTSHLRTRLPNGELDYSQPAAVRVFLKADRQDQGELRYRLEQLNRLDPDYFLLPTFIKEQPGGLEATFLSDEGPIGSAASYAARQPETAVRLAVLPTLTRFLIEAMPHWPAAGVDLLPVSPVLVCLRPGRELPWRIVPVPAINVTLSDWAAAHPVSWTCLPQSALFEDGQAVDSYPLGAMACHFLLGELFPLAEPDWCKFRRFVSGRPGGGRRLELAIQAALPRSFEDESQKLRLLLSEMLCPDVKRRPAWQDAAERFQQIAELLALPRLISRWKYESQADLAQRIEKASADLLGTVTESEPKVPTETALPQPFDKAFRDIAEGGIGAVRRFLVLAQQSASQGGESLKAARGALDRLSELDQASLDHTILDETGHLQIAHIHARYLNADEARLRVLRQSFESTWNTAVACAMRARLRSKSDDYIRISQACKQGQTLIQSMPERGGRPGTYLRGYLYLLDGIAHIGGAAKYGDPGFYSDAFERLQKAWGEASGIDANDIADPAIDWLIQLSRCTTLLASSKWSVVAAGVRAFLTAQGLEPAQLSLRGLPQIPWYAESQVFPT